jgi:hypothetical protein
MNALLAGFIAGIPLGFVLVLYAYVRRVDLVTFFQSQADSIAGIPANTLLTLILACFAGASILFGLLSGLVFSWLGLPMFHYVAIGAVVLFSLFAVVSKTPLKGDKVFWNISVGLILGLLVPILAG